jgi:hypothetical protein
VGKIIPPPSPLKKTSKAHKLSRRMEFRGLKISIETDKGEKRHWYDPHNDTRGTTTMKLPYGYIRRTRSSGDGEHVDVYVGPNENANNVYVVHQQKAPNFDKYDEDKCMLGLESADAAKKAYLDHYNDERFFGSMTVMPFEQFKKKVLRTFERPQKIAYTLGQHAALTKLGAEDRDIGRNLLIGAAAGAPFLGLIGQRRANLAGVPRLTREEFSRMARHGDVVLSGRGPVSQIMHGSPMTHAETILGKRGGKGLGVTLGELTPKGLQRAARKNPTYAEAYEQIAKQLKKDPRNVQKYVRNISERLFEQQGQSTGVILRPKKPLTPKEVAQLRRTLAESAQRPWSSRRAITSTLADWFIPKVHGLRRKHRPICADGICSTHVAQSYETLGRPLVSNKGAGRVLARDLLTSPNLEVMGMHVPEGQKLLSRKARLLGHLGARAGLGLGLAGATYLLTDDPSYAAAPAAGLGAAALVRRSKGVKYLPKLRSVLFSPTGQRLARLKGVGLRTLPLAIATGALGQQLTHRALPEEITGD